ncbi:Protein kinase-like domain protein [Metarhizium brunneum]
MLIICDTSTDEQSTIRLRRAPVANAGDTDIDEQSTDGISSTDSSSGNYETRRRSAAPPPSSRRLETRSNLKRSTTETAPQSPRSKRRGRPSVSQLLGYPCPHLLDAEPDDEAAEVAALLQGFKNGIRRDNLPDLSSASIPSWHPWDPVEEKPLHWESSAGWVRCDNLPPVSPIEQNPFGPNDLTESGHSCHLLRTVPTDEDIAGHFCPRNYHEEQKRSDRTTEYVRSVVSQGTAVPSTTEEVHPRHHIIERTKSERAIAKAPSSQDGLKAPILPQDSSFPIVSTGHVEVHLGPAERAIAQQPSAWVNCSHMSTRELLHHGEVVYKIPRIAGREASGYLKTLRDNTHVEQGRRRDLWVPFRDGVFLAQQLDVVDELQPLLDFAGRQLLPLEENYFFRKDPTEYVPDGFIILRCNDHPILYEPFKKEINATQIVKANGRPRRYLNSFWRRYPDISRYICRGHHLVQGTYVQFEDAKILCHDFGMMLEELNIPVDPDLADQQDCGYDTSDENADEPSIQSLRSQFFTKDVERPASANYTSVGEPKSVIASSVGLDRKDSECDSESIYSDCWFDAFHPLGGG